MTHRILAATLALLVALPSFAAPKVTISLAPDAAAAAKEAEITAAISVLKSEKKDAEKAYDDALKILDDDLKTLDKALKSAADEDKPPIEAAITAKEAEIAALEAERDAALAAFDAKIATLEASIAGDVVVTAGATVTLTLDMKEPFTGTFFITSGDTSSTFSDVIVELGGSATGTFDGSFTTAGTHTLTVTYLDGSGSVTPTMTSDTITVSVMAGDATSLVIESGLVTESGIPLSVSVSAVDSVGNVDLTYSGTATASIDGVDTDFVMDVGAGTVTVAPETQGTQTLAIVTSDGLSGVTTVNVVPGGVSALTIDGGDGQTPALDSPFDEPLDVLLTDAFGNVVGFTDVTFTVLSGGASLDGGSTLVVEANGNGIARVTPLATGLGPYSIKAEIAGVGSVTFGGTVTLQVEELEFVGVPASATVATPVTGMTVLAKSASGALVTTFDGSVTLDVTNAIAPNGSAAAPDQLTVTFSAGVGTVPAVTFYESGTATLSMFDSAGRGATASVTISVLPGDFVGFEPRPYEASVDSGVAITLEGFRSDAYGNVVPFTTSPPHPVLLEPINLVEDGEWFVGTDGVSRLDAVAAALATHDVLLIGGTDAGGTKDPVCYLYEPAKRVLMPGPTLVAPRKGHSATVLDDGRVLVFGGADPGEPVAEIYDPATKTFGTLAFAGPSRINHAVAVLPDGSVAIFGGDDGAETLFAEIVVFDPTSDSFTVASMPTPLTGARAAFTSTGALLYGGTDGTITYDTIYEYDPTAMTLSSVGTMDTPRAHFELVQLDDPSPSGGLPGAVHVLWGGTGLATGEWHTTGLFGTSSAAIAAIEDPLPGARLVRLTKTRAMLVGGLGPGSVPSARTYVFDYHFLQRPKGFAEQPLANFTHHGHTVFVNVPDSGEGVVFGGANVVLEHFRVDRTQVGYFPLIGPGDEVILVMPISSDGTFSFDYVPGRGPQEIEVGGPGITFSYEFTGRFVPRALAQLTFTGLPASVTAGTLFSATVTAVDDEGATVDYDGIVEVELGASADGPRVLLCLVDGEAVLTVALTAIGPAQLRAIVLDNDSIDGLSPSIEVVAGAPVSVAFTGGDGQSVHPGSTLDPANPLEATALDELGNPVAGVALKFILAAGTFTGGSTELEVTTGVDGRAPVLGYIAPATPGSDTVTVELVGTAEVAVATLIILAPAPADELSALSVVESGETGTTIPLSFRATKSGLPVGGETVTFTVLSGSGTLSATSAVTDAAGIATVGVSDTVEGRTTVKAAIGALGATADAVFALPGEVAEIIIETSGVIEGGTTGEIVITVVDSDGATVGGSHTVSITIGGDTFDVIVDGSGTFEFVIPSGIGSISASFTGGGAKDGTLGTVDLITTPGVVTELDVMPTTVSALPQTLISGTFTATAKDAFGTAVPGELVFFEIGESADLSFEKSPDGMSFATIQSGSVAKTTDGEGMAVSETIRVGVSAGAHEIRISSAKASVTVKVLVEDSVITVSHYEPGVDESHPLKTGTEQLRRLSAALPGEMLPHHGESLEPGAGKTRFKRYPHLAVTVTAKSGEATVPLPGVEVEYTILAAPTIADEDIETLRVDAANVLEDASFYLLRTQHPDEPAADPLDNQIRRFEECGPRVVVRTGADGVAGLDLTARMPSHIFPIHETATLYQSVWIRARVLPRSPRELIGDPPESEELVLVIPIKPPTLEKVTLLGDPEEPEITEVSLRAGSPSFGEIDSGAPLTTIGNLFKVVVKRPAGDLPGEGDPTPNVRMKVHFYENKAGASHPDFSKPADSKFRASFRDLHGSEEHELAKDPVLTVNALSVFARKTALAVGVDYAEYWVVVTCAEYPPLEVTPAQFKLKVHRNFPETSLDNFYPGETGFASGAYQRENPSPDWADQTSGSKAHPFVVKLDHNKSGMTGPYLKPMTSVDGVLSGGAAWDPGEAADSEGSRKHTFSTSRAKAMVVTALTEGGKEVPDFEDTATAGGPLTLTDDTVEPYTKDLDYLGAKIEIIGGAGEGQTKTIVAVTPTATGFEWTIGDGWTTEPDATSKYKIIKAKYSRDRLRLEEMPAVPFFYARLVTKSGSAFTELKKRALLANEVRDPDTTDGTLYAARPDLQFYVQVHAGDLGPSANIMLRAEGLALLEARRKETGATEPEASTYYESASAYLDRRGHADARRLIPLDSVTDVDGFEKIYRFGPFQLSRQAIASLPTATPEEDRVVTDVDGVHFLQADRGVLFHLALKSAAGGFVTYPLADTAVRPVTGLRLAASKGSDEIPSTADMVAQLSLIAPPVLTTTSPTIAIRVRDRLADVTGVFPGSVTLEAKVGGVVVFSATEDITSWSGTAHEPGLEDLSFALSGLDGSSTVTLTARVTNGLGNLSTLKFLFVPDGSGGFEVEMKQRTLPREPTVFTASFEVGSTTSATAALPSTLPSSFAATVANIDRADPGFESITLTRIGSTGTYRSEAFLVLRLAGEALPPGFLDKPVIWIEEGAQRIHLRTTALPGAPAGKTHSATLATASVPVLKVFDPTSIFDPEAEPFVKSDSLIDGSLFKVEFRPDFKVEGDTITVVIGVLNADGSIDMSHAIVITLEKSATDPGLFVSVDPAIASTEPLPETVTSGKVLLLPSGSGEFAIGIQVEGEEPLPIPIVSQLVRESIEKGANDNNEQESLTGNSPQVGRGLLVHNSEQVLRVPIHAVPGRGLGFALTLTYRSRVEFTGPVGERWFHNYDLRLLRFKKTSEDETFTFHFYDGAGRVIVFEWSDTHSQYEPTTKGVYLAFAESTSGVYTLTDGNGTVTRFGAKTVGGFYLVDSIADSTGRNALNFRYSPKGQLLSITDPYDRIYEFRYDDFGRLRQFKDFADRVLHFDRVDSPGTANELAAIRFPSAPEGLASGEPSESVLVFDYEGGRLVSASNHGGVLFKNVYSEDTGRVAKQYLGAPGLPGTSTQTLSVATAGSGRSVTVARVGGRSVKYLFPSKAPTLPELIEINGSAKHRTALLYNATNEELASVLSPRGTCREREYGHSAHADPRFRGLPTKVTTFAVALSALKSRLSARLASLPGYAEEIDGIEAALGEMLSSSKRVYRASFSVRYVYGQSGVPRPTEVKDDVSGEKVIHVYDGDTLLRKSTEYEPMKAGDPRPKEVWTYNLAGQLTSYTDPEGRITRHYYATVDSASFPGGTLDDADTADSGPGGYLLQVDRNDKSNSVIDSTRYARDTRGNAIATRDSRGVETTVAYDARDRVVSITEASGLASGSVPASLPRAVHTTEYDGDGRPVTVETSPHVESSDISGTAKRTTTYDALGRPTLLSQRLLLGEAAAETSVTYGTLGLPVSVVGPSGIEQATTYETFFEQPETQTTGSSGASLEIAMSYDVDGNRISRGSTGAAQRVHTFYDGFGNPFAELHPHSGGGRLVASHIDYRGRTLETRIYGKHMTFSDSGGAALSSKFKDEWGLVRRTEHSYNPHGLVETSTTFVPSTGAVDRETTRTYNKAGQLKTVEQKKPEKLTVEHEYDDFGRLESTSVSLPGDGSSPSRKETYDEYLPTGQWTEKTLTLKDTAPGDPATRKTTRVFDLLGRLASETMPGGQTRTTAYDARGNVLSVSTPGPTIRATTYDLADRPVEVKLNFKPQYTVSYRVDGRVASYTNAKGKVTEYEYTAAGLREKVIHPSVVDAILGSSTRETVLTYEDKTGKVKTITDPNGSKVTLKIDDGGYLVERSATPGSPKATYTVLAAGVQTFAYNAFGRVIKAGETIAGLSATEEYASHDHRGRATATGHRIRLLDGGAHKAADRGLGLHDVSRISRSAYHDGQKGKVVSHGIDERTVHETAIYPTTNFEAYFSRHDDGRASSWFTRTRSGSTTYAKLPTVALEGESTLTSDGRPIRVTAGPESSPRFVGSFEEYNARRQVTRFTLTRRFEGTDRRLASHKKYFEGTTQLLKSVSRTKSVDPGGSTALSKLTQEQTEFEYSDSSGPWRMSKICEQRHPTDSAGKKLRMVRREIGTTHDAVGNVTLHTQKLIDLPVVDGKPDLAKLVTQDTVVSTVYNEQEGMTARSQAGSDSEGNSLGLEESLRYDRNGNLVAVVSGDRVWSLEWDALGRLRHIRVDKDHLRRRVHTGTDATGAETAYQLVKREGDTYFEYGPSGRRLWRSFTQTWSTDTKLHGGSLPTVVRSHPLRGAVWPTFMGETVMEETAIYDRGAPLWAGATATILADVAKRKWAQLRQFVARGALVLAVIGSPLSLKDASGASVVDELGKADLTEYVIAAEVDQGYVLSDDRGSPVLLAGTDGSAKCVFNQSYVGFTDGDAEQQTLVTDTLNPVLLGYDYPMGGRLDRETGLHLLGGRYYEPRLGRYLSQAPAWGDLRGAPGNGYLFAGGNPAMDAVIAALQGRRAGPADLSYLRRYLRVQFNSAEIGDALWHRATTNNLFASMQVAGGLIEMGLATAAAWTGVGAFFASVPLFALGADHFLTGIESLRSGRLEQSEFSSQLQQRGLSRGWADAVDAGVGIVLSLGAQSLRVVAHRTAQASVGRLGTGGAGLADESRHLIAFGANPRPLPGALNVRAADVVEDLATSAVGRETLDFIEANVDDLIIELVPGVRAGRRVKGDHLEGVIRVFLGEHRSVREVAGTVVHEITHAAGIRGSQLAEVVAELRGIAHVENLTRVPTSRMRAVVRSVLKDEVYRRLPLLPLRAGR